MASEQKSKTKITEELLDELLGCEDLKEAFLDGGLIDDLKKAIADRALNAEMDVHLEQDEEQASDTHRDGRRRKRVLTDTGAMDVSFPRDRQGRFDPQLIKKCWRRRRGFDDKVIALYVRGMTTRKIQALGRQLYGVDVFPELVSKVTDAVHEEVRAWQTRPLDSCTRSSTSMRCGYRPRRQRQSHERSGRRADVHVQRSQPSPYRPGVQCHGRDVHLQRAGSAGPQGRGIVGHRLRVRLVRRIAGRVRERDVDSGVRACQWCTRGSNRVQRRCALPV